MHQPTRGAVALPLLFLAVSAGCQVSGNVLDSNSDAGTPLNGPCLPGASVACVGPAACSGYQVCNSAGTALEACQCGVGGDAAISGGATDATAIDASDGTTAEADGDSSLRDAPASDGPAIDGEQQEGGPTDGGLTDASMDGESTSIDASFDGGNCVPAADAMADAGMCSGGMCGTIVLFGGYATTDTWTFDGSNWTQISVSTPPPERLNATMATSGNEVVLFGGSGSTGSVLNDTWTFDGTSWTQLSFSTLSPAARSGAAMATLGNELVLSGGFVSSDLGLLDTWTFDGSGWTHVLTNAEPELSGATMATLGNELVLFGGVTDAPGGPFCPAGETSCTLNDTWTFNDNAAPPGPGAVASDYTQLSLSNLPPARVGATMATLGNEVVLFGGNSGAASSGGDGPYLNDTWIFDGTSWTQVPVSSAPPPREYAAMATLGNEIVLFGGETQAAPLLPLNLMNDTWIFDGSNWTQLCVSNPPPARGGAAMATLP